MIWDHNVRVDFLSGNGICASIDLKMFDYGSLLIGEPRLNNHWLLHKIVGDSTYQEIGNVTMLLTLLLSTLLLTHVLLEFA
jgi:hypothetical protein